MTPTAKGHTIILRQACTGRRCELLLRICHKEGRPLGGGGAGGLSLPHPTGVIRTRSPTPSNIPESPFRRIENRIYSEWHVLITTILPGTSDEISSGFFVPGIHWLSFSSPNPTHGALLEAYERARRLSRRGMVIAARRKQIPLCRLCHMGTTGCWKRSNYSSDI